MCEKTNPLQAVLQGNPPKWKPVWLMRQAGRYLPEYKNLRVKAESFIGFCLTPDWAAEATLQPIHRFGVDGAILFADILLIPYGVGQKIAFRGGEGPVLEAIQDEKALDSLNWDIGKVSNVFETVRLVKQALPPEKSLIGFAGGPWTVACYMLEGRGKTGFPKARQVAEETPTFIEKLLKKIEEASVEYLLGQIQAGAEIIQLFESHANLLEGKKFEHFIVSPTQRIVKKIKEKHPLIPIIGFPRQASFEDKEKYFSQTGIDALSLDQQVSGKEAKKLKALGVVQGNLDPILLREGGDKMRQKAAEICENLGPNHIFNLGHGVLPDTPPEHVAELVSFVHAWKEKK